MGARGWVVVGSWLTSICWFGWVGTDGWVGAEAWFKSRSSLGGVLVCLLSTLGFIGVTWLGSLGGVDWFGRWGSLGWLS